MFGNTPLNKAVQNCNVRTIEPVVDTAQDQVGLFHQELPRADAVDDSSSLAAPWEISMPDTQERRRPVIKLRWMRWQHSFVSKEVTLDRIRPNLVRLHDTGDVAEPAPLSPLGD